MTFLLDVHEVTRPGLAEPELPVTHDAIYAAVTLLKQYVCYFTHERQLNWVTGLAVRTVVNPCRDLSGRAACEWS